MPEKYKEKWTINSYMQPSSGGVTINMVDKSVSASDILIDVKFDGSKKFDIKFYNEDLLRLPENDMWNIFFTLFDITLGEAISLAYVGKIEVANKKNGKMILLSNLKEHIVETLKKNNHLNPEKWNQSFSAYKCEPRESGIFRDDVISGVTAHMNLVNDYYSKEYRIFDDFEKLGIKAGFLVIENTSQDMRENLDKRYFI